MRSWWRNARAFTHGSRYARSHQFRAAAYSSYYCQPTSTARNTAHSKRELTDAQVRFKKCHVNIHAVGREIGCHKVRCLSEAPACLEFALDFFCCCKAENNMVSSSHYPAIVAFTCWLDSFRFQQKWNPNL